MSVIGCLTENCGRIAMRRGLCRRCYGRCEASVRSGKTTWTELVAQNRILPSKNKGKRCN